MASGVAITRLEHTASALRKLSAGSRDGHAARRMLALALVMEGHARTEAARLCGMDRQTLRDWVHRYNAEGVAGLSDRREGLGRKSLLLPEHITALAELVRSGPELATHGVVRWRRIDLARVMEERFGVTVNERTVGKALRRLGMRRLSVRPRHPAHDAQAQLTHKKTLPIWSPASSRSTPAADRSNSGGRTRPGSASRGR